MARERTGRERDDPRSRDVGSARLPVVAVAVAAVVLVLGALAWRAMEQRPGGDGARAGQSATQVPASPVPTPTVDAAALRTLALEDLLAARSRAVLDGDRAGWLATADPGATEFVARQGAVFDNLALVPFSTWRYEPAGEGPTPGAERARLLGPGAWVARVVLVYRLADADVADVRREVYLTVVRRGDAWLVADDRDGPTATELWDLGPVQVVRGERALLLGTADEATLTGFVAEADAAARDVDGVWGEQWPRTVVVHVPRDQAEMARLLQRDDESGLDQIAAVTTGELGLDQPGVSGDRVLVNPAGFARLGPVGRQVVLTHEITHVATRATTMTDVPIWLSEGFADYVSYAGTGLTRDVVAQDVLERVRQGTGPTQLPVDADFDPEVNEIAAAYSGSWLAAELLARVHGEQSLVAFYRSVAGGSPVELAFEQVLGTDQAAFEASWLTYLAELAG